MGLAMKLQVITITRFNHSNFYVYILFYIKIATSLMQNSFFLCDVKYPNKYNSYIPDFLMKCKKFAFKMIML